MRRMLILADDLTGAADCGVACACAGLETLVALKEHACSGDAEVLSVDTDTRRMTPEKAALEIERFVRACARGEDLLLFKKIDSTLRGHVAAEIAAVLAAYRSLHPGAGQAFALMAPAFPGHGRTTVNGVQRVHGRPLHETEIWRTEAMTEPSYIPDMLRGAGLNSALLNLDAVRAGKDALRRALTSAANQADVVVCDAETDADLELIASASMELRGRIVWVGSAGLAHHLPEAAGLRQTEKSATCALPPPSGPLLFVIGTVAQRTTDQLRVLTDSSEIPCITAPPEILLAGERTARWHGLIDDLERAVRTNQDVALAIASQPQVEMAHRPLLSSALAQISSSVNGDVGALIASGGETARAVFEAWEVTGMRLIAEVEKGIPLSIAEHWNRPLPMITKAGDFGTREALLKCRQVLRQAEPILAPRI
jgi:D-threonate/D-erythronate kinase